LPEQLDTEIEPEPPKAEEDANQSETMSAQATATEGASEITQVLEDVSTTEAESKSDLLPEPATAEDEQDATPWHILPEYRRRIYVDLKHPTHTILVSALRGVCGMSVVERYDERKKFNVQMLSGTLRVRNKDKKPESDQYLPDTQAADMTPVNPAAETMQWLEPDGETKATEDQTVSLAETAPAQSIVSTL